MDKMASLAFGAGSSMVTCQESENNYDGWKTPNRFMGPSLYDTVVAEVGTCPVRSGPHFTSRVTGRSPFNSSLFSSLHH